MNNLPDGYTVKYEHRRRYMLAAHHMPNPEAKGGSTVAHVYDAEGTLVAEGTAIVHPNDNYNKRIGRAVSLGRALKQLGDPYSFKVEGRSYVAVPSPEQLKKAAREIENK